MKLALLFGSLLISFNILAAPYVCEGSSHFGLKSYVVIFSKLQYGVVNLQVTIGQKDYVLEKVKLKRDYVDSSIINFHGLGVREIELSGYLDTARSSGLILLGNSKINLKNCD